MRLPSSAVRVAPPVVFGRRHPIRPTSRRLRLRLPCTAPGRVLHCSAAHARSVRYSDVHRYPLLGLWQGAGRPAPDEGEGEGFPAGYGGRGGSSSRLVMAS
jgi:hypothetical protein